MPQGITENEQSSAACLVHRHQTRPFRQPLDRVPLLGVRKISSQRNIFEGLCGKSVHQNVQGSKVNVRKAQSQCKRRSYLEAVMEDYGSDIKSHLKQLESQINQECFLEKHRISEDYRGKMVDWMSEVLHTFKCSDQTFFLAIDIMDRFFKNASKPLESSELHLTGIVAMFIASKYEDVVPLLMKTIVNKIGHNKFSVETIQLKELEILKALGFKVGAPTVKESLDRLFEEIKDLQVFNQEMRELSYYIAKLACHNYALSQKKHSVLAVSVLRLAMKIQDQRETVREYKAVMKTVLEFYEIEGNDIKESSEGLLYLIQNFDKQYKGFKNVAKQYEAVVQKFNTPS